MPFVHQALNSLTCSLPCHITYLLLPSVAGVIAAFYSSFSVCHIPGSANPLASPLLIVALQTCHISCKSLLCWKNLGFCPWCSNKSKVNCKMQKWLPFRASPWRAGSRRGHGPGAQVSQDSLCPTSPEISSVTLSTKETVWMRGGNNWGKKSCSYKNVSNF